jgi:hypothetical protein
LLRGGAEVRLQDIMHRCSCNDCFFGKATRSDLFLLFNAYKISAGAPTSNLIHPLPDRSEDPQTSPLRPVSAILGAFHVDCMSLSSLSPIAPSNTYHNLALTYLYTPEAQATINLRAGSRHSGRPRRRWAHHHLLRRLLLPLEAAGPLP